MADLKHADRLALLERIALEEIGRRARRGLTLEQIRDRAPDAVFDRVSGFDELDELEDEVDESLDTWLVRALEELDVSLAQGAAADSDRLDAAFATLCARGVLARQGVGWSTREGLTLVLEEAHALRQRGADARGYAFFCDQEIDAAIEDDRLHIAFGAVSGQRDASRAVGDEVVVALREAGLAVRWDGDRAKEILVEPFRWFRRPGSLECDEGEPRRPPRAPLPPLDAAGHARMEHERAARERDRESAPVAPIRLAQAQVHPLLVERAAQILGLSMEELDAVFVDRAVLFEDSLTQHRAGWASLGSPEADDYDRGPLQGSAAVLYALEARGLVGAPWKLELIAPPPFRWHGLREVFERARASSASCGRVLGFVPTTVTGSLRRDVDALFANGRRCWYTSRIVAGEEATLSAIPPDPSDTQWAPSTSLRDVLRVYAPDLDVERRLEHGQVVRSAELGGDPDVIAVARVVGLRVEDG